MKKSNSPTWENGKWKKKRDGMNMGDCH